MKKVLFSAFAALAFAFTMTACGNNQPAEATEDTTAAVAEECDHHCMHEGDSAMCCKAEGAAEEHACCAKEGEHKCAKAEGQECEHKCAKAEGKEFCKKAEGEHKCAKAEGKECEHKCQK